MIFGVTVGLAEIVTGAVTVSAETVVCWLSFTAAEVFGAAVMVAGVFRAEAVFV